MDISFIHQILCIAKALDEHGIILNLDDMYIASLRARFFLKIMEPSIIPISKNYPPSVTLTLKEEMDKLGITDYWDFFFHTQKLILQSQKERKKKRWFLF